jgi:hypothetical protein
MLRGLTKGNRAAATAAAAIMRRSGCSPPALQCFRGPSPLAVLHQAMVPNQPSRAAVARARQNQRRRMQRGLCEAVNPLAGGGGDGGGGGSGPISLHDNVPAAPLTLPPGRGIEVAAALGSGEDAPLIHLEVGRLARLAHGACAARAGGHTVIAAATSARILRRGIAADGCVFVFVFFVCFWVFLVFWFFWFFVFFNRNTIRGIRI